MAYTTIKKPSDYFNTTLYTGNATARTIDVGFQPDLIWGKLRSTTGNHWLWDSIRGANYYLKSNATDGNNSSTTDLTGFVSNGFTVGTGTRMNTNSETMASWNWKANGAGSANTDGDISSTVSVNTTSGFSIVSYTGTGSNATIGHGLGVAPSMVITKRLSSTDDWIVWQKGLTNPASYLYLNSTNAEMGSVAAYQNITPTSTLLYPGTDGRTNGNGDTYISYCFADVQGYSKFGSYTGNGNADGTFVYTGFKPAFVLYKDSTSVSDWVMKDNGRPGFNVIDDVLYPNLTDAEGSGADIDFLSNGFKARTTAANTNKNNAGFIYMAFAEEPLVGDNPATAR